MASARVLIADDSDKLLSALRIQLEANGFDVITCSDAYMALEQARRHLPHAIILDIRMPAGDGFNVLERMRKIPELKGTPIIYITGDQAHELDFKAQKLGAFGLIHKPIVISALLKMLDSAIERGPGLEDSARAERVFEIPSDPDTSDIPGVRP
jgi:DNA-binding response OmpR family regulator